MTNSIFYKRLSGSSIQGDATQVTEPQGTVVIANDGSLRLHDGTTAGGNPVGGGTANGWQLTSSSYVVSLNSSTGVLTVPGFMNLTYGQGGADTMNFGTGPGGGSVNATAGNSIYVTTNGGSGQWVFGNDGVLTLSTASTILGNSTDPNVYIETATSSTLSTWKFGTDGVLTLPADTPIIKGNGTGTDVTIVATTGTNTATWVLTAAGSIELPNGTFIDAGVDGQGIGLTTDRGTIRFGNRPEVIGGPSHYHIMRDPSADIDLYFGDDYNYLLQPTAGGVTIGSNIRSGTSTQQTWVFGTDGTLTFPDNSVQTTAYTANTPPALVGLLSTATTIAITAATEAGGPSANIDVTITNHQVDHYGSTAYTGNILSTGLVVIPDNTQSPPIAESIVQVGSQSLTQTYNLGSNGSPAHSHYIAYAYVVTAFGTVWSAPTSGQFGSVCLIAGTMILLSDGTRKAIEDINYTDKLQSWNFDQGCYAETTALWIKQAETGYQYNLLTFSDGTTLRTFDQHRIFNKEAGAFTYPMTDATPIGTTTVNEYGQEITLVDKQVIQDTIEYYNVITDYHMNLFSDTILTSCRFNNIYPITDMKFVKDGRTPRTRDEFADIPDRFFYGLRLAEQTTDIETVEWYVTRLLALEESFEAMAV